jgi:hypothetical protein
VKLREKISDLMFEFLEHEAQGGRSVDIVALTGDIAQSVIDDEVDQGPLLACIMTALGNEYLRRRGLVSSERRDH